MHDKIKRIACDGFRRVKILNEGFLAGIFKTWTEIWLLMQMTHALRSAEKAAV